MSLPATVKPALPLLPYQIRDIESPARFRWNCWARQTGKSFTKSMRRIMRGLERQRTQIFLSAGERQCRELMEKARAHCYGLKVAADASGTSGLEEISAHRMEIRLPRGVRIIGLPANPQTVRGYTGDVFLDEFAMHREDREIWAAIFPTLLRGEGELDIASTPKGRGNMFDLLRGNDLFEHTTLTLPQAIGQGLSADMNAMRQAMNDGELFRQEFLCEFLDEARAFLTYEQILACAEPELTLYDSPAALVDERRELFVGVDIGRRRDMTVVWVLAGARGRIGQEAECRLSSVDCRLRPREQGEGGSFVTVAVFELSHAPFREQASLLGEVLALRHVRRCCIDAGGLGMQLAEEAVERFGPHRVEAVTLTRALKSQLAGALRIAVEGQRITIPHDERLIEDWHSVERSVTEQGHFRLAAPRREGSHADRFWAAALALHAAGTDPGPAEAIAGTPLRFERAAAW